MSVSSEAVITTHLEMILSLSLVQVVILLPLLALVTAWLYIQWAYHRQLSLARKLPTAIPAYPLIGHLHMKPKFRADSQTWKLVSGHRSGLSCAWLGPVPWIMINKAEHMKVILNNSNLLGKAKQYHVLQIVYGNGLLTAPVNMWKISRKHINPMFNSEKLQHSLPMINENARHLVEDLSEHVGKKEFDCEDCLFQFSVINILEFLFGPYLEINRKSEVPKDLKKAIKILLKLLGERAYNPLLKSDTVVKLLRKQDLHHMEVFRKHLKVLSENSNKLKDTVESNEQMDRGKTFQDIFNQLKDKNPIFNEDYMLEEMATFFIGGTDTNSTAMSFCLVALGSHPDIQKHLYEEIISVVGKSSEVYAEDISKMTYLDQVLNETLRFFSITPVAARRCDDDIQLDGHTIPKDTTVILSFIGLHNNEEVFPDPRRFDPDRFSPENCAKRHSYSFLPFSGGPRNCIGKNFAMIAMKIALVHLLKNYEVKSDVDIKNITYKFSIIMESVDGNKIYIKKRF